MTQQHCTRVDVAGLAALMIATLAAVAPCQESAQDAAQKSGIANGGFEEQDDRDLPVGWVFPPVLVQAGYRVRVETVSPLVGEKCALLDATTIRPSDRAFGNLMQSIDATEFRGKRVRFRAAVRTAELSAGGRAQLWFRVDRAAAGGQSRIGAFDNMQDHPIRDGH